MRQSIAKNLIAAIRNICLRMNWRGGDLWHSAEQQMHELLEPAGEAAFTGHRLAGTGSKMWASTAHRAQIFARVIEDNGCDCSASFEGRNSPGRNEISND